MTQFPSRSETIALAAKIIKKYEGMEFENSPIELVLAQGALAMYGEQIRAKYNTPPSKYFAENDALDHWEREL